MSDELEQKLLEAIDILVTQKIANLRFDITIKGVVIARANETTGEYKVKYQDSILTAYSDNPLIEYSAGTAVYVFVPQGDFAERKIIKGAVDGREYPRTTSAIQTNQIDASAAAYEAALTDISTLAELSDIAARNYAADASAYAALYAEVYADGIVTAEEEARLAAAAADMVTSREYAEYVAQQYTSALQEDLENQMDTYVGIILEDIDAIQTQVDSKLEIWYYYNPPTSLVEPESLWSSNDKYLHLGDLYYDLNSGAAYRYILLNDAFSWERILDSDLIAALEQAADAQDTADNKRRVFVTDASGETPYPPYDIGDLWTEGQFGDLKRCWRAKGEMLFSLDSSGTVDPSAISVLWTTDTSALLNRGYLYGNTLNHYIYQFECYDSSGFPLDPSGKDASAILEVSGSYDSSGWLLLPYAFAGIEDPTALSSLWSSDLINYHDGHYYGELDSSGFVTNSYEFSSDTSGWTEIEIENQLFNFYEEEDWELATQYTDDTVAYQALQAAANAQEAADGMITGFYADATAVMDASGRGYPPSEVSGAIYGDIWIDTSGADSISLDDLWRIYRWQEQNGSNGDASALAWWNEGSSAIGLAFLAAYGAQATADGKIASYYVDSSGDISDPGIGDFWIDTNDNLTLYRWDGDSWEPVLTTQAADAYTVVLTNEAHMIPCDTSGIASAEDLLDASSSIIVYKGASNLSAVSANPEAGEFSFSINSTVGCGTRKLDNSSFDVTGLTANSGKVYLDIFLESSATVVSKVFSWSKSIPGEDALLKTVIINRNAQMFTSDDGGVTFEPSEIILTPEFTNTSYFKWEYSLDGSYWEDATGLEASGITIDLTGGTYALSIDINEDSILRSSENVAIGFKIIARDFVLNQYTSSVTIPRVLDGANATRTAYLDMYQWAPDLPSSLPDGSSIYTWSDGTFTPPETSGDWTLSPGTPQSEDTLWLIRKIHSDSNIDATSLVIWDSGEGNAVAIGMAGADAKYVVVSGSQVFKYAPETTIPDPSAITLTANLYGGLEDYQWQYYDDTPTWTTLGTDATGQTYTLTYNNSHWGSNNSLRIRCLSGDYFDEITLVKIYDGSAGVDGINARTVNLSLSTQVFIYDSSGNRESSSPMDISAIPFNFEEAPYYQFYKNNISQGSPTITSVYSYSIPTVYSNMPETIKVEVREGASGNPVVATDIITIYGAIEGQEGALGPSGRDAVTLRTPAVFGIHETSGAILLGYEFDYLDGTAFVESEPVAIWPTDVTANDLWIITNYPFDGMVNSEDFDYPPPGEDWFNDYKAFWNKSAGGTVTYIYDGSSWSKISSDIVIPGETTISGGLITTNTLHGDTLIAGTVAADSLRIGSDNLDSNFIYYQNDYISLGSNILLYNYLIDSTADMSSIVNAWGSDASAQHFGEVFFVSDITGFYEVTGSSIDDFNFTDASGGFGTVGHFLSALDQYDIYTSLIKTQAKLQEYEELDSYLLNVESFAISYNDLSIATNNIINLYDSEYSSIVDSTAYNYSPRIDLTGTRIYGQFGSFIDKNYITISAWTEFDSNISNYISNLKIFNQKAKDIYANEDGSVVIDNEGLKIYNDTIIRARLDQDSLEFYDISGNERIVIGKDDTEIEKILLQGSTDIKLSGEEKMNIVSDTASVQLQISPIGTNIININLIAVNS